MGLGSSHFPREGDGVLSLTHPNSGARTSGVLSEFSIPTALDAWKARPMGRRRTLPSVFDGTLMAADAEDALPANLLVDTRLESAIAPPSKASFSAEVAWREAMRHERADRNDSSSGAGSPSNAMTRPAEELWRESMKKEKQARLDTGEWQRAKALQRLTK
jgi:hypothetical protein